MDAMGLVRSRIRECEAVGVELLCCPEGILGGLADYADDPRQIAIGPQLGEIRSVLAPLASDTVTTIIGFTELGADGLLYNSAAVLSLGEVSGIYRKQRPAINRSVYAAGRESPVFRIRGLIFGIVICYDSTFPELAGRMSAQGAQVLLIPTNNALPLNHTNASPDLNAACTKVDVSRAVENRCWIVRADVVGRTTELVGYGASEIVSPQGAVVRSARSLCEDLIIADLEF